MTDSDNIFCATVAAQHLARSTLNERQSIVLINSILSDGHVSDYGVRTSAYVDAIAANGPRVLPHVIKQLPRLRKKSLRYAVVLAAVGRIGELPNALRSTLHDEFDATLPEKQAAVAAAILNCGDVGKEHETAITMSLRNSEHFSLLSIVLTLMRPADWFERLLLPRFVTEVRADIQARRWNPGLWRSSQLGGRVIPTLRHVGDTEKDGVVELVREARLLAIEANSLDTYGITITLCRLPSAA